DGNGKIFRIRAGQLNQRWTPDLPRRAVCEQGRLPLSVIDLHPQAATVDFIAAKTRIAVTRGNGARTGIDQIVAADPSAVALRQPFRKFDETPVGQVLDALITAKRRLLSIEAKLIAEIPEDQFRVCLADGRLT